MKSKHAQHLVPRVVVTALFASVCLSPPSARLCAAYESPKASAILGRYTEVFPRPWRYQVCDRYIPDWAMEELSADSDRPPERIESKAAALKRCRDDTSNPLLPQVEPVMNSTAYEVPRESILGLSLKTLVDLYVSTGIPVVLTGFNATGDHALWERQKKATRGATVRDRKRDEFEEFPGQAAVCNTEDCNAVLQAEGSPDQDLSALAGVALLDATMPFPGFVTKGGVLFSGKGGHTFGGTTHFDSTCHSVLNLQMQGTKDWTLWSPSTWEVGPFRGKMLPPHSRFVTTLREGEALLFTPAWYHATQIRRGEFSVATSTDVVDLPVYSALKADFYTGHPFGYENCGKHQWKPFNQELEDEMRRRATPLFAYQERGARGEL